MPQRPEAAPLPMDVISLTAELAPLGFQCRQDGEFFVIESPTGETSGVPIETLEQYLREHEQLTPGVVSELVTSGLRRLKVIKT